MKATPQLRAKVEAAAKESGLSIAQEVERRLISSIEADDRHGGAHNAALMTLLSSIIQLAEARTGARWTQDYSAWVAVRDAISMVLNANKPTAPGAEEAQRASDAYVEERLKWTAPLPGMPLVPIGKNFLSDDYAEDQERLDQLLEASRAAMATPRTAHVAGAALANTIVAELLSVERR